MFNESKNKINLKTERPDTVLRNSSKIKFNEKFTKKSTVLNSPLYRGYKLWSVLSKELQKIDSLLKFKKAIKQLPRL